MAKNIRSINKRRICRSRGCGNILSIYNLEAYCHVHQQLSLVEKKPPSLATKR
ncbi:hypothetical protein ACFL42_00290 [Candidatus Omnitrophota bacterium]